MIYINQLADHVGQDVTLHGWVYNYRSSGSLVFIELRDGTGITQCVVAKDEVNEEDWEGASSLKQESSLSVTGMVKADERSVGGHEMHVSGIRVIQFAEEYPITPKEHGIEFLMNNRHLWLRSQRQWAAMRVRNEIIFAIHTFFQNRNFVQMDSPIFTGNAAEGSTTLFETDYFEEKAYLAQTGQLYGEAMAMAHGLIYTFGPTFRAEKSKTRRHLTEFWMMEPEMAFYDLTMNMDLAEDMIRFIVKTVLEKRTSELDILDRDTSKLTPLLEKPFVRMTYDDAVQQLKSEETAQLLDKMLSARGEEKTTIIQERETIKKEHGSAKKWRKKQIEARITDIGARIDQIEEDLRNIPNWKESAQGFEWGNDFGGSDETVLMMQYDVPVFVTHWPAQIKAFYMKRDQTDKLALGMDVLAPEGYGEIIGGSQREDSLEVLKERIEEEGLDESVFSWYLDLRKFGSVPHSGFGMGLERTVAWLCGLSHVRETVPFPRMMGRLHP
ncbi:MAG: asparagine--tRNA ligase [Bacteroidota bacterium]